MLPSRHQQPLHTPIAHPSHHNKPLRPPHRRHADSTCITMQAPPPTPNPDYFSLNRTPAQSRDSFVPNSLPALAMMLNEEVAVMNHINNALVKHLQDDKVIERLQSTQDFDPEDKNDSDAEDRDHRPPNGHKEDTGIPPTSSNMSTPTEEPHYTAAQQSDEASTRRNRAYSTSEMGNLTTHSLPSPIVRMESRVFDPGASGCLTTQTRIPRAGRLKCLGEDTQVCRSHAVPIHQRLMHFSSSGLIGISREIEGD